MVTENQAQDSLSSEELEKGLNAVVMDGIMSHLMGVLTGGVFLVAIALRLGATNFQIGLLAAIPPLSQLSQIPAVYLIETIKSRKKVTVYGALISRFAWLLVVLSPFLFSPSLGLVILIIAVIFHSSVGGISGVSWNSWMRDLIPEEKMGSFFSKRLRIATFIGLFASLLASGIIDGWKKWFPRFDIGAYSLLFSCGFIIGLVGVRYLSKIPDVSMLPQKVAFFTLLKKPFTDKNFKRLLIFLGSWAFAVNLAAPFFTVYMLKRLKMGMSMVVAMSIVSQVFNFLFLGLWGKWTDRFSNKSVLAVSGPLFLISILAWTFTTFPEKYFLTIPLLILIHIIMGMATAGVNIASGNIGLKLAPKGQATAYLATNALINSVAAGSAPLIGGKLADLFAQQNLSILLQWSTATKDIKLQTLNLQHWDFLFGISVLLGFYALHRLSMLEEKGEVDEKIVFDELMGVIKRPIRSLSTGAGLLQLVSYPFSAVIKSMSNLKKNNSITIE